MKLWPILCCIKTTEARKVGKPAKAAKSAKAAKPVIPVNQNKRASEYNSYEKPAWMEKQSKLHLVIDDSDVNRLVLRKYLEMIELKVEEGSNGVVCLEKVKEDINKYDVIWMDIRMPYMDGFEATQALRKLGFQHMIIGLTGHVESESLRKCIELGMDKVIAKPIMREELYGLLFHLGIESNKL